MPVPPYDVTFDGLFEGRLIERLNRFVVAVELPSGEQVKAHTNNTGTMRSCSEPGSLVYLAKSDNPNRKLKYSLILVESSSEGLVGVDTSLPQKLFVAAMARRGLEGLEGYDVIGQEVVVAPGSRLDVLLDGPQRAYVELKNVSLYENGRLYFPDAVTARGAKHLQELARLKSEGSGAFAVFIVQRPEGTVLSPADHIDPHFGQVLRESVAAGVVPLAYRADVSRQGARLGGSVPIEL